MTVQTLVGASVPAPGRELEVYDFQRPTTLGRDQMRALSLAFDNFSRQWGTQLTAMTHVLARADVVSIDVERYGEFADTLPEFTALVLLSVDGMTSHAILQLAPDVALSWVGRMLGGNARIQPPARIFTAIEDAVIGRLVDYVIEDLTYSLGDQLSGGLSVFETQYNPQMAQAMRAGDFAIVVRFTIHVGDHESAAILAFPIDALAPRENRTDTSEGDHERLLGTLETAPVTIALQLESATVGPNDILNLSEGDLLRLPHPEYRPLNLTVDGVPIARAAAGTSGARLACVIVTIEES
ncbi:MAG TPA: flagellar motor switch protein FliM [Galbitalea sp.]|jgi:flagellar motor switch protein FliM